MCRHVQDLQRRAECADKGVWCFNLSQVSPAAFLFLPKDLLPDPLTFCRIKSHLSLAQCAKLTGLRGHLRSSPGGVGKRAVPKLIPVDTVLKDSC